MELTEIAEKAKELLESGEDENFPEDVENFWEGFASSDGFWYNITDGSDVRRLIARMYKHPADRKGLLEAIHMVQDFESDYYACFGEW